MPFSHTHDPEFDGAEAQPQGPAPHDGGAGGIEAPAETVSEPIEEAWRAAGRLALRETQLAAVRHGPQLRRAASDLAIALNVVLAFLTALALANWAAASALSGPLPGWAAALVLATTWIVIGILLVLVLNRGDRVLDWRRIWRLGADVERRTGAREWASHEAQQRMRESLEQLAGQVGERAGAAMVSSAVVPVAGGVISAGEHVIDQIDELTDDLGKAIPGGGVINRVADMAILPGRHLVGVVRTALEGLSDEVKSPDQPSSIQSRPRKVSGPKWAVWGMKPSRFRSGKASEIDVRSRDRGARTGDEVSVSFNAPGHRAQRHDLTDDEADGLRVVETVAGAMRSTS